MYLSCEMQKKRVSVIEVKDLRFRYRNSEERILKGVNLEVEKGEFLLLVGPSGCGKTTLVNSINGIIPHVIKGEQKGTVRVLGMDIPKTPLREISKHVGTVFQNPETQFFMLRVIDELVFGPENLNVPPEEIEERLKRVTSVIPGLKEILYKETLSLSGGQKQKVAIASVLMMGAKILILDEPTTNLDPRGAKEVLEAINAIKHEKDITIILIEHRLDEVARFADRVIVMNEGNIIREGDPREVFSDPDIFYKLGIRPPQPAELIVRLKEHKLIDENERVPLTVDEAVEVLKKYIPEGFTRTPKDEEYKPSGEPVIEIRDLRYVYPDGTVALRGISLNIYKGEYVGIVGQNGAGKSTLVMNILGVLEPSYGSVKVLGHETSKTPVEEIAKSVGVIFQNPDLMLFQSTVRDEIALGPKNLSLSKDEVHERVSESIEMMRLKGLEKRHPHALSRGQRHRVAVASILAMRPKVLVADEPTTGQDYGASRRYLSLLEELNKQGRTIIVISHDMKVIAEFAKRVIVMKKGRILLDGPTREVFDREDILAETYLEPPKITQIAKRLGLGPILTTDEFIEVMKEAVAKLRGS